MTSESPNHRNTLLHFAGTDDVVRVGSMSDGESFFQKMLHGGVTPWQAFGERVAVNLSNVTYIEEEIRFDDNDQ